MKEYRAVGNRVAVPINTLDLPITTQEALKILNNNKFKLLDVDIVALARECINVSLYRRGARFCEAPSVVDCSSYIKWLYAQRGVWLPRRSIQQREFGEEINLENVNGGDVVFTSGPIDYYRHDPIDGVGHVAVVTDQKTVIHADGQQGVVIETTIQDFLLERKFRGVRRYISSADEVLTFESPVHREVESSDDVRWIIMQSL